MNFDTVDSKIKKMTKPVKIAKILISVNTYYLAHINRTVDLNGFMLLLTSPCINSVKKLS